MRALFYESNNPAEKKLPRPTVVLSFFVALAFLCTLAMAAFASLDYNWNWSSVYRYKTKFIEGWLITIAISSGALVLSLLIGALSSLATRSRFLPLRYLVNIYVELTRGTPLLVQILIIFYVFADAANIENRYLVGTVILALFSGAYISEIFRAGIQTVGNTQLLSTKAIGFTPYQTFRYVIFPQALRNSLPALAGQFANLIKDSSLLSIIAVSELTLNAQEVNSATLSSFESFFPLAIGYLLLTLPIMQLSRYIERRVTFET